jgi:hypothetical protein
LVCYDFLWFIQKEKCCLLILLRKLREIQCNKSQEILYKQHQYFSHASLRSFWIRFQSFYTYFVLNKLSHGCRLKYLSPERVIISTELYKTEIDREIEIDTEEKEGGRRKEWVTGRSPLVMKFCLTGPRRKESPWINIMHCRRCALWQ